MEVSADQLQQAVEGQHGGKAVLVSVEPVKETFQGKTLEGHRPRVRSGERRRFFAVLHLGGIRSPVDAVRAAIVAENKGRR